MSLTYTDVFCGAGGSSVGLSAAGFELRLAANHWDRAIETHSANFPAADHLCADVSNYDMRQLPRTDVLWASPECTWHSPAGGRRRARAQLDLLGDYVPLEAADRSRMTMVDVIRAAEVHRYRAVVVENVIEVAAWELFDWWLDGMGKLGYEHRIVSVSSAHVGGSDNEPAPQWRDRLYVVFLRGVPFPDLEPRPPAWCPLCEEVVGAVQAWKRIGPRIGKYGQQYVYRCPSERCQHAVVEPYVLPAAAAIDWSDLGTRIGDRKRPLADATMRRIRAGLEMFCQPVTVAAAGGTFEREASGYARTWPAFDAPLRTRTGTGGDGIACPPLVLHVNHDDLRVLPADASPLAPRTTKIGDGVVCPPFMVYGYSGGIERRVKPIDDPLGTIVANGRGHHGVALPSPFVTMLRANNPARGIDEPLDTITTGRNHALTVPQGAFYVKNYGGNAEPADMAKPVSMPLGVITGRDHHALVIPFRRGNRPRRADSAPLPAVSTKQHAGLLDPAVEVEECHFRMLKPREHLNGQRFPHDYIVHGNQGEQTMQAGNAVSSNVAQWLGECLKTVL